MHAAAFPHFDLTIRKLPLKLRPPEWTPLKYRHAPRWTNQDSSHDKLPSNE